MPKVRWSAHCAGGCGVWLLVGQRAVRAHRSWWCPDCWIKHAPDCTLTHPVAAHPKTDTDQLMLPV